MLFWMSLALTPFLPTYHQKDTRLVDILPHLTKEERYNLKRIVNLMDEKIFTPIIEAEDKESIIINKSDEFYFYLSSALNPILNKIINKINTPELISKIYDFIRSETKEYIKDDYTSKLLYETFDIIEEHDRYIIDLLPNYEEIISLIEIVGPEKYLHIIKIIQLTIPVTLISFKRKPSVVTNLSLIVNKYADKLEPFVANFQISITPELALVREKTSEEDIEKAKELRGSILEL